jgi:hypothetical protein
LADLLTISVGAAQQDQRGDRIAKYFSEKSAGLSVIMETIP